MSDLVNRHNIVDKFYNNMNSFSLSNDSTPDIMIFCIENELEIKRYVKENKYEFSMYFKGTFEEIEYSDALRFRNPSSDGWGKVRKSIRTLAPAMSYENGHFKMISTANNDNWIQFDRSLVAIPGGGAQPIERLITNLNMTYQKLPLTEEYHFQRTTTNDGLVLDLDYCLKVQEIIDFIDSLGSIVVANEQNNLTISLLFTDKLGKGG